MDIKGNKLVIFYDKLYKRFLFYDYKTFFLYLYKTMYVICYVCNLFNKNYYIGTKLICSYVGVH